MRPSSPRILILGLSLVILGMVFLFFAMEGGSSALLAMGVGSLILSGGGLSLDAWRRRLDGDPLDQRRERRLWKSGPLGRKWLEGRRKTP